MAQRNLSEHAFRRGEVVFRELQAPARAYIVKSGHVRLVRYNSTGRVFALAVVHPGRWLCINALVNRCTYPCRAIADVESTLVSVPASVFDSWLQHYPGFGYAVLKSVCQQYCQAHALCSASQESARHRVLKALETLVKSEGLEPSITRQDLADLAGVSRETANRVLLHLQGQGVLRLGFRRVRVQQPQRLAESV